jgi:hypothetical protein
MVYAVRQPETGGRTGGIEALSAQARGRTPHISCSALQTAVFVTSSTEYEVRDGICCSVRDRSTGAVRVNHRAIGMQLVRLPQCGEILHLVGDSFAVLMTSVLEEVRTTGAWRSVRSAHVAHSCGSPLQR